MAIIPVTQYHWGDVDDDGSLDIIVGQDWETGNQLLTNEGDGIFDEAVALSGGIKDSQSISLGHVDNDGSLDIIIGNSDSFDMRRYSRSIFIPTRGVHAVVHTR